MFIVASAGSAYVMHTIFDVEDVSYKFSNIITANKPDIEFSPSVALHSGFLFCLGLVLFLGYLKNKVQISGELSLLIGIYLFYTMIGIFDIYSRLRFHLFSLSMALIFWNEFYGYLLGHRRLLTDLIPYILTILSLGVLVAQNVSHIIYTILYFPYVMVLFFMVNIAVILYKHGNHPRIAFFYYSVIVTVTSSFCWLMSSQWFHWNRIGWTIFLVGFALIYYLSEWDKETHAKTISLEALTLIEEPEIGTESEEVIEEIDS